jgi:membrane protease subunit HflK
MSFWQQNPDVIIQHFRNYLDKFIKSNIQVKLLALLGAAVILLLTSGIYQVEEGEEAMILRFGKFSRITSSGLHYKLPYPIESLTIENTMASRQVEIGAGSETGWNEARNILTKDENLLKLRCVINWHIKDIKNFLIKVYRPDVIMVKICQSAIREIISDSPISDALSNKKEQIGEKMQNLIQRIADQYMTGIEIEKVQLLAVEPPAEVISAYRDVQSSRADKENKINEAYAYKNSVVTEAIGEANKMIRGAEAINYSLVSKAEGDTKYFEAQLAAYQGNKAVTKHRLIVDVVEKILKDNKKIIIDNGDKTFSYLPLADFLNKPKP